MKLELPAEICASGQKTPTKIPTLDGYEERRNNGMPPGQSFRLKPQYRGRVHDGATRWLSVRRGGDGKRRAKSAETKGKEKEDPYREVWMRTKENRMRAPLSLHSSAVHSLVLSFCHTNVTEKNDN